MGGRAVTTSNGREIEGLEQNQSEYAHVTIALRQHLWTAVEAE